MTWFSKSFSKAGVPLFIIELCEQWIEGFVRFDISADRRWFEQPLFKKFFELFRACLNIISDRPFLWGFQKKDIFKIDYNLK